MELKAIRLAPLTEEREFNMWIMASTQISLQLSCIRDGLALVVDGCL